MCYISFLGSWNKLLQVVDLIKTTEIYSLPGLKARSPESNVGRGTAGAKSVGEGRVDYFWQGQEGKITWN